MDKMLRNKGTIAFFVLPALLLYAYVLPVPILKTIYYSFFSWDLLSAPTFIGMTNYRFMFTNDIHFYKAVSNTFIIAFGSILVMIPLGLVIAYLLSGKRKGTKLFRNTFFMPVIISGTSVGLLWQFIFHGNIGLINTFVRLCGYAGFDKDWLADPAFAIYGVLIALCWQYFGYHVVILLTGLSTVSQDVVESARIDGATGWSLFGHILIPLIRPFLLISLLLGLTGAVKSFDNVISLTGGGPASASEVIALLMYNNAFLQIRYGYGSALAVVLLALNIAFTLAVSVVLRGRRGAAGKGLGI